MVVCRSRRSVLRIDTRCRLSSSSHAKTKLNFVEGEGDVELYKEVEEKANNVLRWVAAKRQQANITMVEGPSFRPRLTNHPSSLP